MRNITKLLDKADEALKNAHLLKKPKGQKDDPNAEFSEIESSEVAAIAGFGAVVINLDLLPALAVYENNHKAIVKALGKMVTGNETPFFDYCKQQYNTANLATCRLLKEQVIDASIALKIIARTYKINKNDE